MAKQSPKAVNKPLQPQNSPVISGMLLSSISLEDLTAHLRKAIMEEISTSPESGNAKAEIIDREELCKRLRITAATAITWAKKGKIPSFRIGSSIRYNWISVLDVLENQKGTR